MTGRRGRQAQGIAPGLFDLSNKRRGVGRSMMSAGHSAVGTMWLAVQAVLRCVLNQNRNVVPYPSGVQQSVLLLDDVFNAFPWYGRVLIGESFHNMAECPQFFIDSHFTIVRFGR